MPQTDINIRMDEALKREFDALCGELGLTMTAAFTVFAKAVTKKRAILFEISADANSVLPCKAATTDTVESMAGVLHKYANPALIPHEAEAWEKAVEEKYAAG